MTDAFNKWFKGLEKTSRATFGRMQAVLGASEINDQTWEDLESLLVEADIGIETTVSIITSLRKIVNQEGLTTTKTLKIHLSNLLVELLEKTPNVSLNSYHPTIVLLVGVNGSGKTTTAAKLAWKYAQLDRKVMLGAADTFRAAAVEQLKSWGERLDIPVVSGQTNADPGSVAFDSVQSAISKNSDILFIDTAGRLHTRFNLMEEIKKVHRVLGKALPGAPHACWLILDATTGQNALLQAKAFKDSVDITGIILTKLDTSARGGMAFSIQKSLKLPILFAGLGEGTDDLEIFNREEFVAGILNTWQE